MRKLSFFCFTIITILLNACSENPETVLTQTSPNKEHQLSFGLGNNGVPYYLVTHQGKTVIDTSLLGFSLQNQGDLKEGFEVVSSSTFSFDDTWEQPWGEQQFVRNHYNELRVNLQEKEDSQRKLDLVFRLFDDGVAFRYEFPEQENLKDFVIMSEHTQFRMTADHSCWWIPANYDSYEYLYTESRLSEIDASPQLELPLASIKIPILNATHTPLTMKTEDGLYLSIQEADITDYAGMTLRSEEGNLLECELVPWRDGSKVKTSAPSVTPWRIIQMADTPGGLLESAMILNLNDPNELGDVSWVQPMKYIGIWWGMHLKAWTWEAGPRHGATTERTKQYIDFAAENGFGGVLVEGWNLGWEPTADRSTSFDFVTPYPDFDLEEVARYGREKGVSLIGHHETFGGVSNYEQRLDTAMALYGSLGVAGVKTGYVGPLVPEEEYHQGQWFVRHMQRVIEEAAKNKISVVAHEPIKASGKRRTYPNMVAREAVRGSEFNSPWGGGNPPEHMTIVPFTRMLSGPIDYTPGLFKLELGKFREGYSVPTTLAYQLAEYVVVYSPVQMASDLIEHYELYPDAFEFIKQVGVDWETSRVLDAEIGEYVVIARKEKSTGHWFVGALTDEKPRNITVDLSFLDEEKGYQADIYRDAPDAHYQTNPEAYEIEKGRRVMASDKLELQLAPGGGAAIVLLPEK
jgi:hypothetical protein